MAESVVYLQCVLLLQIILKVEQLVMTCWLSCAQLNY
jgi:hypothetical protein